MPEGLGPRFVLEAAFLIVLAAVATYARLEPVEIVLVMTGGWFLASLFEVLANRRERVYTGESWESPRTSEPAPPAAPPEESKPSPVAEPVAPPVPEVAETEEPQADDESTGEFEVPEPKRRRWFRRERPEPSPPEETAPAAPRHVRLIRTSAPDEPSEREDAGSG